MTYAWLISFVCLYYVRVLFCSFYYIALHNKSCLLTHYLNPHKLYLLYYVVTGVGSKDKVYNKFSFQLVKLFKVSFFDSCHCLGALVLDAII